ncbi:MAG TPA: hypothetical protein VIT88_14610 [Pyrinomonadaceae bacterium]
MRKILTALTFVLLLVYTTAAQVKSLTGVVADEMFENKWSAIVIDADGRTYGIQTEFHASAGDNMDGTKSWRVKTVGDMSKGRTVLVSYRKMDCSRPFAGIRCWLTATSIVEQRNSPSEDWSTFWRRFTAAVNTRNRLVLPKMMASEFSWPGEGAVSPKVWLDFQDRTNAWRTLWRDLQKSVASGTKTYHDASDPRETRVTNDKALLFQRGHDGKWRWIGFLGA